MKSSGNGGTVYQIKKKNRRQENEQAMKAQRMAAYKQGEKVIKKKWKEKYGDASVDEVLGH